MDPQAQSREGRQGGTHSTMGPELHVVTEPHTGRAKEKRFNMTPYYPIHPRLALPD